MNGLRETMYRRAICHSIGQIIAEDFVCATLITLHCSGAVTMPQDLAKRLFKAWVHKFKRTIGGAFKHIRITDYGPHPVPEVVFYVVVDLPVDTCCRACDDWHMGTASAAPLDEGGVDKIARAVIYQADTPDVRIWSYSSGKKKPRSRAAPDGQ